MESVQDKTFACSGHLPLSLLRIYLICGDFFKADQFDYFCVWQTWRTWMVLSEMERGILCYFKGIG